MNHHSPDLEDDERGVDIARLWAPNSDIEDLNPQDGVSQQKNSKDSLVNFTTHKLACPYFIADPPRFQRIRACSGLGFSDLHRLTEHLGRHHKAKLRCGRCQSIFESKVKLTDHQQEDDPCQKVDPPALIELDGFDEEQGRWKEWFRILLPVTANRYGIPSPYTEMRLPRDTRTILDSEANKFGQFARIEAIQPFKKALNLLISECGEELSEGVRELLNQLEKQKPMTYEEWRQEFEKENQEQSPGLNDTKTKKKITPVGKAKSKLQIPANGDIVNESPGGPNRILPPAPYNTSIAQYQTNITPLHGGMTKQNSFPPIGYEQVTFNDPTFGFGATPFSQVDHQSFPSVDSTTAKPTPDFTMGPYNDVDMRSNYATPIVPAQRNPYNPFRQPSG